MDLLAIVFGVLILPALVGVVYYLGKRDKPANLDERLLKYLSEMKRHRLAGTLTVQKRKELLEKYLPQRETLQRGKLPRR